MGGAARTVRRLGRGGAASCSWAHRAGSDSALACRSRIVVARRYFGRCGRQTIHIDPGSCNRDRLQPWSDPGASIPPGRRRERPHGSGPNGRCHGKSGVIRVLIVSDSSELETAIRSSASLEFAGRADPSQLIASELAADVLLVQLDEVTDHDWSALAELPIPVILLMDPSHSTLANSALRSGIRGAILSDATPDELESAVIAVNAGLAVTTPDFLREPHPFAAELLEPLSWPRTGSAGPIGRRAQQQADRASPQHLRAHRQDSRRIHLCEVRRLQPHRSGVSSHPAWFGDALVACRSQIVTTASSGRRLC